LAVDLPYDPGEVNRLVPFLIIMLWLC
jgi:hypothetical protein